MIAIHHGTPQAVDARLREAFVEHVLLVNDELLTEKEDLLDEKAALEQESEALASENIQLRHEVRIYALAERKQTLLRQKLNAEKNGLKACLEEIRARRKVPRSQFEHDGMLIQFLFEAIDNAPLAKEVAP